jgi:WD40 repeat protein
MTQAKWLAAVIIACGSSGAFGQQNQPAAPSKPPTAKRVAFSPDGKSLAVAHSVTNSLDVWDLATRKRAFVVKEASSIAAFAYSPKGNALAIATGNVIKLVDPATGKFRRELAGHDDSVRCLTFSADGSQLFTGGADRSVIFWDTNSGEVQRTMVNFPGIVSRVAISPDGKTLATYCERDDAVKLWELAHLDRPPHSVFPTQEGVAQDLVFSADSRYLVVPNNTGSVPLIEITTGEEVQRITDLGGTYCAAFSPDGQWLAIVQLNAVILIPFNRSADAEQKQKIAVLIEQFKDRDFAKREAASTELGALGEIAFRQLKAGLESTSAEVRMRCRRLIERLESAQFATKLVAQNSEPISAAFSPDGKLLASGDWQGKVKLWDVSDAKELATLEPEAK